MTIAIIVLLLLAYLLIATEHLHHINKATTAMFAGVVGWVLYIIGGADKMLVADDVLVRLTAYMAQIVLYLLSTMAIVEVLSQNGCFDFIRSLLLTRQRGRFLWGAVLITFLLSANLDNLTTSVLMLTITGRLLQNRRQRLYVGSAVVIAACCGGMFTVIGDVTTLMVWTQGAITPTSFAGNMVLPALVATIVPVLLISYELPETLDLTRPSVIYRGDDSVMPLWQRLVMLFLGIGGLWFIPTLHRITLLPPFMGSLCVLGIIWVLNEIFNHRGLHSDQPLTLPGSDRRLQYEVLQVIMYFVGICLSVGLLVEVGALQAVGHWIDHYVHDIYVFAVFMGVVSAVLDNICLVLSAVNIYDVVPEGQTMYEQFFMQNGDYWHLVILSACVGGLLLPIGCTAGYALMRSEDMGMWWYFRKISGKVLLGWIAALITYFGVDYIVNII